MQPITKVGESWYIDPVGLTENGVGMQYSTQVVCKEYLHRMMQKAIETLTEEKAEYGTYAIFDKGITVRTLIIIVWKRQRNIENDNFGAVIKSIGATKNICDTVIVKGNIILSYIESMLFIDSFSYKTYPVLAGETPFDDTIVLVHGEKPYLGTSIPIRRVEVNDGI